MKKRISKLDELVNAARAESPVVSFEESARRIAALEKNRRRGAWTLVRKAFAFPRQAASVGLRSLAALWATQNGVFVGSSFAFSFGRLRAATLAFLLLAATFPALIHDARFGAPLSRLQQSPLAESSPQQTFEQNLEQSLEQAVEQSRETPSWKARTEKTRATSQNLDAAVYTAADPNAATDSFAPTFSPADAFAARHSFTAATDSSFERPSFESSSVENPSFERASFERFPSPALSLSDAHSHATQRLERAFPRAERISQENQDEETLWSRLSVEARISARADIRPNAVDESAAPSPLQNLSFAVYYAVSESHSFGVEGGNEPFASTSFTTAATDGDQTFGTSSLTTQGTEPRINEQRLQRTLANRAWAGASYQYSAETLDILGGIQPCARLTIGGGELGGVGRALLGARFLPKERFSFILAGEGAAVASAPEGAWEFTPRLGVTFGVSVKF